MTVVDEPRELLDITEQPDADVEGAAAPVEPDEAAATDGDSEATGPILRPVIVSALAVAAAALMAGGIFGSWPARLIALGGGWLGVLLAVVAYRSRRQVIVQALVLP